MGHIVPADKEEPRIRTVPEENSNDGQLSVVDDQIAHALVVVRELDHQLVVEFQGREVAETGQESVQLEYPAKRDDKLLLRE